MLNTLGRILRSPDVDPLATPAGDVDTSMPLLAPDKLYNLTIAKVEKKTNDAGVEMLKLTLKTTKDELDNVGKVVNAGFPVFHNFIYTPTGGLDIDMIKKSGATLLKGLGLKTTSIRQLIDDPQIIVDKVVCVKLGTRKEKNGYPASTEIKQWVELK